MERRAKKGVDFNLESEANKILAKGREGVTKHSAKKDYLSPSQLQRRRGREVNPTQGFPEKQIVSGLFKRAYNPTLGKKPTLRDKE